jgi:hypothetical protein
MLAEEKINPKMEQEEEEENGENKKGKNLGKKGS